MKARRYTLDRIEAEPEEPFDPQEEWLKAQEPAQEQEPVSIQELLTVIEPRQPGQTSIQDAQALQAMLNRSMVTEVVSHNGNPNPPSLLWLLAILLIAIILVFIMVEMRII
jgi:hypothetical protein